MVKEMLDFARPLEPHCALAEITPLLDQSLAVVSQIADEKGIRLEKTVSPNLAQAYVDEARLKQAIINLLVNAIQASTTGQAVCLGCSQDSAALSIEVRDCGCGIPPERREKVLSPFFTTKKEGTGLGLANVSKIVEAHRGTIEILDNPEGGTVFKIAIPQPAT
jgi:signal transduction histidine kinase